MRAVVGGVQVDWLERHIPMDSPETVLVLLAAGGIILMLVFGGLLAFLCYKLKLFVPKSKLFDEAYTAASIRNVRRLVLFSRILLGVCCVFMAGILLIHTPVFDEIFTSPPFLAALGAALVTAPIAFGAAGRKPGSAETAIAGGRMQHIANESTTPARRRQGRLLGVAMLFLAAAAALHSSFYRSMGLVGVLLRLAFSLLLLVACVMGVVRMFRAPGQGGKPSSRLGQLLLLAVWMGAAIWWAVPCALDLAQGPVTRPFQVTSFTGQFLGLEDRVTGQRISLRIRAVEHRTTLEDLWNAWQDSRAFFGDPAARAQHPEAADRKLYCTVTYYAHTRYRVAVDDIAIQDETKEDR